MKKIIIAGAITAFGLLSAQKNTLLVGGNVAYNTTKTELGNNIDSKNNSFEFSPTVGYQFADHWTIGVNSSFTNQKTTGIDTIGSSVYNTEMKSNMNKIGGFIRYAQPLSDTFAVYGDLGAGAINRKDENFDSFSNATTTTKYNGMYVQFTPALFINFKNSFGLNFNIGGIGYSSLKNKGTDLKTSNFDFNFGKSFSVGISKNFGLK